MGRTVLGRRWGRKTEVAPASQCEVRGGLGDVGTEETGPRKERPAGQAGGVSGGRKLGVVARAVHCPQGPASSSVPPPPCPQHLGLGGIAASFLPR